MVNLRTWGGSTAETKSEQSPSFVAARTTVRRFAYRSSTVIGASFIFGLPSRPSTGSPSSSSFGVLIASSCGASHSSTSDGRSASR